MSGGSGPQADLQADPPPPVVRALFGGAALLMGALILGAAAGLVPADPAGWLAPMAVVYALGAGLWLFAAMLWLPRGAPMRLRSALAAALLLLVAVVCNWSAFAPDVQYTVTTESGGREEARPAPVGGRIVFGAAALTVNALLLGGLAAPLARRLRARAQASRRVSGSANQAPTVSSTADPAASSTAPGAPRASPSAPNSSAPSGQKPPSDQV